MVCVTDTRQQQDGCGRVEEMALSEYLQWWRRRRQQQGPDPTQPRGTSSSNNIGSSTNDGSRNNFGSSSSSSNDNFGDNNIGSRSTGSGDGNGHSFGTRIEDGSPPEHHPPHYYLKDWHFCSVAPPGYKVKRLAGCLYQKWQGFLYQKWPPFSSQCRLAGIPVPGMAFAISSQCGECSSLHVHSFLLLFLFLCGGLLETGNDGAVISRKWCGEAQPA
jgi:hypothetical protein